MELVAKNEQTFNFNGHQVRFVGSWENPLYVARDIAKALEYPKLNVMLRIIPEIKGVLSSIPFSSGQKVKVLSEWQLNLILMRSERPAARPFQLWIAQEVLPSIRKTGRYGSPNQILGQAVVDKFDLRLPNACGPWEFRDLTLGFRMVGTLEFEKRFSGSAGHSVRTAVTMLESWHGGVHEARNAPVSREHLGHWLPSSHRVVCDPPTATAGTR